MSGWSEWTNSLNPQSVFHRFALFANIDLGEQTVSPAAHDRSQRLPFEQKDTGRLAAEEFTSGLEWKPAVVTPYVCFVFLFFPHSGMSVVWRSRRCYDTIFTRGGSSARRHSLTHLRGFGFRELWWFSQILGWNHLFHSQQGQWLFILLGSQSESFDQFNYNRAQTVTTLPRPPWGPQNRQVH